jgi:sugar phosphate permease
VEREAAETCTGLCGLNFIGNASLQFGPVDNEFKWSTFFFLFFYWAGQSEIRILALGRASTALISESSSPS